MSNHEEKSYADKVHVFMAFQRPSKGGAKPRCLRQVVRDYEKDLELLEARCRIEGGPWRIHRTVNLRDTEKARLWLIHKLIDDPSSRGFVDSRWRTALLQPDCAMFPKNFMLDVDTKDEAQLKIVDDIIRKNESRVIEIVETPNGWHYIVSPFDTRELAELKYVSIIRDGYIFVKEIGNE